MGKKAPHSHHGKGWKKGEEPCCWGRWNKISPPHTLRKADCCSHGTLMNPSVRSSNLIACAFLLGGISPCLGLLLCFLTFSFADSVTFSASSHSLSASFVMCVSFAASAATMQQAYLKGSQSTCVLSTVKCDLSKDRAINWIVQFKDEGFTWDGAHTFSTCSYMCGSELVI